MKITKYQITMTTLAVIALGLTLFTPFESFGKLVINVLLGVILIISVVGLIQNSINIKKENGKEK